MVAEGLVIHKGKSVLQLSQTLKFVGVFMSSGKIEGVITQENVINFQLGADKVPLNNK